MNNYFAKNFKYLQKRFAVTQDWTALQLGKSQSTIGAWGQELSEPSIELLIGISRIFGISLDFLVMVDLEKGNLISDEHVAEFKKNGKVNSNPIGKPSGPYKAFNADTDTQINTLKEGDPTKEWALMTILRTIDGKIDQVLNCVETKSKKKG